MAFKHIIPSLLLVSLTACQSTQMPSSPAEQTTHTSQGVYLVEYQAANHFAQQAKLLESQFSQFCQQNSDSDLKRLKHQWQATMAAWMALQGQERGPAKALEQSWSVQFWPDKKDTTGRKMGALTNQDKNWAAAEISENSVTVQGLGSIEWLLYDPRSPFLTASDKACNSAIAISQNLSNKASTIEQAWQQNPWKALDEQTWKSEYIALLSNQLEFSMSKLSRPMAKIGQPRPYFSESWRSKVSMLNLKANIQAMQLLYLADGNGLDKILRDHDLIELADRVKTQYASLVETWPEDPSLFHLLNSKEGYRTVLAQYNKLDQLKYLLHDEVSVELNVVIGFNATDGD